MANGLSWQDYFNALATGRGAAYPYAAPAFTAPSGAALHPGTPPAPSPSGAGYDMPAMASLASTMPVSTKPVIPPPADAAAPGPPPPDSTDSGWMGTLPSSASAAAATAAFPKTAGLGVAGPSSLSLPWNPDSFKGHLSRIESNNRNIFSGTDKDYAGRPGSKSQGFFQIDTPTAEQFARAANIDLGGRGAMQLSPEDQSRLVNPIPFARFGPNTQLQMNAIYGKYFPGGRIPGNLTVGELDARFGGSSGTWMEAANRITGGGGAAPGGGGAPTGQPTGGTLTPASLTTVDGYGGPGAGGLTGAAQGGVDPTVQFMMDRLFPNQQAYATAHPWLNAITQTLNSPLTQAILGYLGSSLAAPHGTTPWGRMGLGLQGGLKAFTGAEEAGFGGAGGELGGMKPAERIALMEDVMKMPEQRARTEEEQAHARQLTSEAAASAPNQQLAQAYNIRATDTNLSDAQRQNLLMGGRLAALGGTKATDIEKMVRENDSAALKDAETRVTTKYHEEQAATEPVRRQQLEALRDKYRQEASGMDPKDRVAYTISSPDGTQSVVKWARKGEDFVVPKELRDLGWTLGKPTDVMANKLKAVEIAQKSATTDIKSGNTIINLANGGQLQIPLQKSDLTQWMTGVIGGGIRARYISPEHTIQENLTNEEVNQIVAESEAASATTDTGAPSPTTPSAPAATTAPPTPSTGSYPPAPSGANWQHGKYHGTPGWMQNDDPKTFIPDASRSEAGA